MSLVKQLGEHFLASDYYRQALTHRSVGANNNERLEYLGDSLLGFFVAEWLFKHYPGYPEGDLTRLRAHLVRKETLAEIAREQNLGELIKLGAGELKSGGVHRDSILADALEALIGAIYLSEGLDVAKNFILKVFTKRLEDIPTVEQLKDAKTRLQELLQSNGVAVPKYVLQGKAGKSGNEIFTVECFVENCDLSFQGTGKNRRRAEQDAAQKAYVYMANKSSANDQ